VKYEQLPNICYYCGRVGHIEKDCEVKRKMAREQIHTDLENGCRHLHGRLARTEVGKSVRTPILPVV